MSSEVRGMRRLCWGRGVESGYVLGSRGIEERRELK